jgi:hypothetical protein
MRQASDAKFPSYLQILRKFISARKPSTRDTGGRKKGTRLSLMRSNLDVCMIGCSTRTHRVLEPMAKFDNGSEGDL